jgi:hypothetical protein
LQALGFPIHLKKQFGNSYGLSVMLAVKQEDIEERLTLELMQFLAKLLQVPMACVRLAHQPFCKLELNRRGGEYHLCLGIMIDVRTVDMVLLFESILEGSNHGLLSNIVEWELTPLTMEDVFIEKVQLKLQ